MQKVVLSISEWPREVSVGRHLLHLAVHCDTCIHNPPPVFLSSSEAEKLKPFVEYFSMGTVSL